MFLFWKKTGWWLVVGGCVLGMTTFGWTQERIPSYSPLPGGYMETSYNGAVPPLSRENEQTIGEILASQPERVENAGNPYHVSQEKGVSPGNVRSVPVVPARYYESHEAAPLSQAKPLPSGVQQATHVTPAASSAPTPQVLPQDIPQGDLGQSQNGMIAFSETVTRSDGKFQQITLIDPVKRSLCVYHVNLMTGQIELRSARDIQWDLQLVYLNSKKPLPNEVQAVIQSSKRR
ncbi:MAG: hypothetical protein Q4D62_01335 [Planctomycetia bacterium]|nr:hypothetical protein [Planctomycetia bacterium]